MQTILGSTGIIGTELARNLITHTDKIRLVSRDPKPVNPGDELITADLLDSRQVINAVKDSEVVYLVAGLKYDIYAWQSQWPVVMQNVIDACELHGAKLVFFDNVYSYGKVKGWMTEESPYEAKSQKGLVRVGINTRLMDEVKRGAITAMIVRAADFYGPGTSNSFANLMVLQNLKSGKKAQWLVSGKHRHSLTYTPDAGKATALLGNTPSAYNQMWHLPADLNVPTGRDFINMAANELKVPAKTTILPKPMIRMAGLFNPIIRETIELLYQFDSDYLFDCTKFNKAFDFKVTTYPEGIKATVASLK
jgi:nucleoside-diphosphate-sugar epimerase